MIKNSIDSINKDLIVAQVRFTVTTGTQKEDISIQNIKDGNAFENITTSKNCVMLILVELLMR